jgi:hypothetical protein
MSLGVVGSQYRPRQFCCDTETGAYSPLQTHDCNPIQFSKIVRWKALAYSYAPLRCIGRVSPLGYSCLRRMGFTFPRPPSTAPNSLMLTR